MRSKAPLALMEQLIMVLVFALAAVLCLRAFVWSDQRSRQDETRDQAVLCAQNAAETLRHVRGDGAAAQARLGGVWDGQVWTLTYDSGGQSDPLTPAFTLTLQPQPGGVPYLGQALVTADTPDGTRLVQLTVRWQEVTGHDA